MRRLSLTILCAILLLPSLTFAQLSTRVQREIEACVAAGDSLCAGGDSTSISGGGGACTVNETTGAIDCTPASGQDMTVTVAGGGAAVVTGGNVELASGTRIIVPDGETFITGTDADSGLRFFSNKNLSWYVDSAERVRFGSGGRVSTTDGVAAGTSIVTDVALTRSAANVWRVSSNGSTGDADLWVNRAIGIGAVTPTMGLLHIDKGTGFGQATLDGSSGGCIMFRDTDDAGWTEVTFLNGTITSTTDADGVCDGS